MSLCNSRESAADVDVDEYVGCMWREEMHVLHL